MSPVEMARFYLQAKKYREAKARGTVVKPLFINFPVTYMCNARCVMCNIWKIYQTPERKREFRQELTVKEIEYFFTDNREFLSDLIGVGLTGGEAFLRPDLVEIIRTIRTALPHVNLGVQTNGLFPPKILRELKKITAFCDNFGLAVSLDGLGDTHATVRGTAHAYDSVLETIRGAKALGVQHITCGMTVTSANYDQILQVRDKVEELGCIFSCFLADTGDYFDNAGKNYRLTPAQLEKVTESLEEFQYHYYMDTLRRRLAHGEKRTLPCYSGIVSLVLDPYGDVRPCLIRNEVLGNVRNGSLHDLLQAAQARKTRTAIKNCIACWTQCEVTTSAVADPADVLHWFLRSQDKLGFIRYLTQKSRIARKAAR